jgi:hypothetical protein
LAPDQRFTFEPLGNQHDRAAFRCGIEALDSYLQKQASQDIAKRAAVAFVATLDGKTIAGYYTLTQYAIDLGDIPEAIAKKLPKYSTVPATLLGRLARHTDFYKQRLGELLLMDALRRSLDLSKQAASTGVIVDAKDDKAADFYRRYQFIDPPKVERRLFLPMRTIEPLFPAAPLPDASV